jgi:hypothetical protein
MCRAISRHTAACSREYPALCMNDASSLIERATETAGTILFDKSMRHSVDRGQRSPSLVPVGS